MCIYPSSVCITCQAGPRTLCITVVVFAKSLGVTVDVSHGELAHFCGTGMVIYSRFATIMHQIPGGNQWLSGINKQVFTVNQGTWLLVEAELLVSRNYTALRITFQLTWFSIVNSYPCLLLVYVPSDLTTIASELISRPVNSSVVVFCTPLLLLEHENVGIHLGCN